MILYMLDLITWAIVIIFNYIELAISDMDTVIEVYDVTNDFLKFSKIQPGTRKLNFNPFSS